MLFRYLGALLMQSTVTALLPIIAGYQLSPDRIQIDLTSPKFHLKSSKWGKAISKANVTNAQQMAFKIYDHYWNMNLLFSGGDNW